jgi:hypothetical protein
MEVHGKNSIGTGGGEHVGDKLRRDRNSRLNLSILARVSVVRNRGRNSTSAGALQRVDNDQKLHEVVVARLAGALHNEHITSTHVITDLNGELTIRELNGVDTTRLYVEPFAN